MTTELYRAAERLFNACNAKPKDIAGIVTKLQNDHQVQLSVEGNLLVAHQNGALANLGQIISAYRTKYPRDFYGEAGEVNFKSDLAGDTAAMSRYVREHGLSAWEALPASPNSLSAHRVVRDVIPHEGITREQYGKLSTAEKVRLTAEIGPSGIERILARK